MKRKSRSSYGSGIAALYRAGVGVAKRFKSSYSNKSKSRFKVKSVSRYGGPGSRTTVKYRKKHRPLKTTDDEVLKCTYKLILGNRKLYNKDILGKNKYLLSGTATITTTPGFQDFVILAGVADPGTMTTLENTLPFVGTSTDRNWFLKSAYWQSQILNASNSPIECTLIFYVAKQNIDSGDPQATPRSAWIQAEGDTNNGAVNVQRSNYLYHQPHGTTLSAFWRIAKTCKFSLGPFNTKRVNMFIEYNKLMNKLFTLGTTNGALRGISVFPMLIINGSPAFTDTGALTTTAAKVGCVTSINYSYYALAERSKVNFYNDGVSHNPVLEVGNVDLAQAVIPDFLQ